MRHGMSDGTWIALFLSIAEAPPGTGPWCRRVSLFSKRAVEFDRLAGREIERGRGGAAADRALAAERGADGGAGEA